MLDAIRQLPEPSISETPALELHDEFLARATCPAVASFPLEIVASNGASQICRLSFPDMVRALGCTSHQPAEAQIIGNLAGTLRRIARRIIQLGAQSQLTFYFGSKIALNIVSAQIAAQSRNAEALKYGADISSLEFDRGFAAIIE